MSLIQQIAPGSVAGRKSFSPPSMSDAHDFFARVECQKGHGCVPVLHVSNLSAISGAEYK